MNAKPRTIVDVRGVVTRFGWSRALLPLVGSVLALALVPASGAAAARKTIPDVTVLFPRAVKIVRATDRPIFVNAVMLEAVGTTGGPPTKSASGIDQWQFWLNNAGSLSRFRTAMIRYGPPPKAFGRVTGYKSYFGGDRELPKAPAMTLKEAVRRLQKAGYTNAFLNVTLRNPLVAAATHPEYIFAFALHTHVAVDTVTKQVFSVG